MNELDCVILTEEFYDKTSNLIFAEGQRGTVVHVHNHGEAFEVEFFSPDGKICAVATVPRGKLDPIIPDRPMTETEKFVRNALLKWIYAPNADGLSFEVLGDTPTILISRIAALIEEDRKNQALDLDERIKERIVRVEDLRSLDDASAMVKGLERLREEMRSGFIDIKNDLNSIEALREETHHLLTRVANAAKYAGLPLGSVDIVDKP